MKATSAHDFLGVKLNSLTRVLPCLGGTEVATEVRRASSPDSLLQQDVSLHGNPWQGLSGFNRTVPGVSPWMPQTLSHMHKGHNMTQDSMTFYWWGGGGSCIGN